MIPLQNQKMTSVSSTAVGRWCGEREEERKKDLGECSPEKKKKSHYIEEEMTHFLD